MTHETIIQNVHEIREEVITREIHNDHIFHRIQPIVDIEVLPARHFVPIEGGYAEISQDEVPGRTGANAQWLIAETVSKGMPKSNGIKSGRQFTARTFEGAEGDYKEHMAPEGFKRTEQYWVHPPTAEDGGRITGQTYPFVLGSPNPEENGLRASLPAGEVIGTSPLLARQRRALQEGSSTYGATTSMQPPAPPVPQHKMLPTRAKELANVRAETQSPRFL